MGNIRHASPHQDLGRLERRPDRDLGLSACEICHRIRYGDFELNFGIQGAHRRQVADQDRAKSICRGYSDSARRPQVPARKPWLERQHLVFKMGRGLGCCLAGRVGV
jgi:hypothetical protein